MSFIDYQSLHRRLARFGFRLEHAARYNPLNVIQEILDDLEGETPGRRWFAAQALAVSTEPCVSWGPVEHYHWRNACRALGVAR